MKRQSNRKTHFPHNIQQQRKLMPFRDEIIFECPTNIKATQYPCTHSQALCGTSVIVHTVEFRKLVSNRI